MIELARQLEVGEIAEWRANVGDVAVVTGRFDILHPGNMMALRMASEHAENVCIALEADDSSERFARSLDERLEFASSLKNVAAVVVISSEAAANACQALQPYTCLRRPGTDPTPLAACATEHASRLVLVEDMPAASTRKVAEAVRTGATPIPVPADFSPCEQPVDDGDQAEQLVTVNGCFDILHIAHVRFLKQARAMGDELVVLMNSDESVRRYKGNDRPVFPASFRAAAICALRYVDGVRLFEDDTPVRILSEIQPAVHVKGGSYDPDRADHERTLVESWGGRIEFCPMVEGYSTTNWLESLE